MHAKDKPYSVPGLAVLSDTLRFGDNSTFCCGISWNVIKFLNATTCSYPPTDQVDQLKGLMLRTANYWG